MKLWKIVLFALFVIVASCSIQKKPTLQITHVLAVTQQGDTLTIPIDVIRPINYRIINYSNGYNPWPRPYYHNYNYTISMIILHLKEAVAAVVVIIIAIKLYLEIIQIKDHLVKF